MIFIHKVNLGNDHMISHEKHYIVQVHLTVDRAFRWQLENFNKNKAITWKTLCSTIGSSGLRYARFNCFTNKWLLFWFKAITSYKNSGTNPVKSVIGRYKLNLEALKIYKSWKAITDLIRYKLLFSKINSNISVKMKKMNSNFLKKQIGPLGDTTNKLCWSIIFYVQHFL
jgi:hypothetical protein